MPKTPKFDAVWVENRKKYRKNLKGTRMTVDPITGYLEPVGRKGFSADYKNTFIERFRVCNNMKQIAESLKFDQATIYDAIAVDKKFRDDVNACYLIEGRSKQLRDKLEEIVSEQKNQIIADLSKKL